MGYPRTHCKITPKKKLKQTQKQLVGDTGEAETKGSLEFSAQPLSKSVVEWVEEDTWYQSMAFKYMCIHVHVHPCTDRSIGTSTHTQTHTKSETQLHTERLQQSI